MKLKMKNRNLTKIKNEKFNGRDSIFIIFAYFIIFSFGLVFICESISRDGYFSVVINYLNQNPLMFLCNLIFFLLVSLILYFIFSRPAIPVLFLGASFVTLSVLNYVKMSIRYEPIFPWDLFLIGEAANMGRRTDYDINLNVFIGAVFIIIMISMLYLPPVRKITKMRMTNLHRMIFTVSGTGVLISFLLLVLFNTEYLKKYDISPNTYKRAIDYTENGFIPSLLMNLKNAKMHMPEEYNAQNAIRYASEIEKDMSPKQTPNIIFLMSESYCNFTSAEYMQLNEPLTPEFDNLRENYISGKMLSPQFAGGTANCEFEVLTGFSNSFIPLGSTPYQQYVNDELPSYPRYIKDQGYTVNAIHTYGRSFFNRENVYRLMGFDKYTAADEFLDPQLERGFISDGELTKKIIETFEAEQKTEKPAFIFSISVQNHGSYSESDYAPEELISVDFKGSSADEETQGNIRSYLTGVKSSDKALGDLLRYFEAIDEPTIIVFFGDHFPQFNKKYNAFEEIGFIKSDDSRLEIEYKTHSVDFAVWNNFDVYKKSDIRMSQYQLIPFLAKEFSLPRPVFFDYLNEQREIYAGNALSMYLNADGTITDKLTPFQGEYMEKHMIFQYDILVGGRFTKDILYK